MIPTVGDLECSGNTQAGPRPWAATAAASASAAAAAVARHVSKIMAFQASRFKVVECLVLISPTNNS